MDITTVRFDKPDDLNVVVGQGRGVLGVIDEVEAERKELLRRFGYKL